MENKTIIETLTKIEGEMRACFNNWDKNTENGVFPVAIQDLDYWSLCLQNVIKEMSGSQIQEGTRAEQEQASKNISEICKRK
jgi:hypothetical protein